MAVKIVLDAGHGGYDNGASFNDRNEKDDTLKLTLAVGEILKAQGYDVVYTRTEDVYDSPVEKARIGNQSGADYFVSIHRNSSPTPNQYNGVQTLVYNDTGTKATMARNINKELEQVGYRNINVVERPDLAVLRRTQMPAVLVEVGFINSEVDNQLLDDNFSQTAEAIARGIDETLQSRAMAPVQEEKVVSASYISNDYYGIESKAAMKENDRIWYQILIGIYRSRGAATYHANQFANDGYDTEIYDDDGLFQVRVGQFANLEDAQIMQRELRDKGYDTLIVRKNYKNS